MLRSIALLGLVSAAACVTARPATPSLLVSLSRGPCFGRCPEYEVEVFSDGRMRFEGRRHVATVGEAKGRLDAAQLEAVQRRFEAARFAEFAGRYERVDTTDLPVVVLAYQGRVVRHALGDSSAPATLTQLEDDVDALLGTARWVTGAVER